jgi:hypothetical protein
MFIFTFIGVCLVLTAFGVFIDLRIGSGWDIPSGLRLPATFALATAGILFIWSDLREFWRPKSDEKPSSRDRSVVWRVSTGTLRITGLVAVGTIIILRVYELFT